MPDLTDIAKTIIEAGEKATARPWRTDGIDGVYASSIGLVAETLIYAHRFFDASYITLAANHADELARAYLERQNDNAQMQSVIDGDMKRIDELVVDNLEQRDLLKEAKDAFGAVAAMLQQAIDLKYLPPAAENDAELLLARLGREDG